MARILYGIHGTGHGHAMRGLTIARAFPEHEFLFAASDDALSVLAPEFSVYRIPNLGTAFKNYAVDMRATIGRAVPLLIKQKRIIQDVLALINDFKPNVCMTDLEYFVPRAALAAGIPCLTLDHQHIITCCEHSLPPSFWWDTLVQGFTPRYLFRPTDPTVIVSFYAPPLKPKYNACIVPPLLRKRVLAAKARDDGHVLVYQSNTTHSDLISFLRRATKRICYVFGYRATQGRLDNVVFMEKSEDGFLDLLRRASYVIQGGSHTLMSEALYLGKPILSIPVESMLEQRFNALYLERLGYGLQTHMRQLSVELLSRFEQKIPNFRAAIARSSFCGNEQLYALLGRFFANGRLELTRSRLEK